MVALAFGAVRMRQGAGVGFALLLFCSPMYVPKSKKAEPELRPGAIERRRPVTGMSAGVSMQCRFADIERFFRLRIQNDVPIMLRFAD